MDYHNLLLTDLSVSTLVPYHQQSSHGDPFEMEHPISSLLPNHIMVLCFTQVFSSVQLLSRVRLFASPWTAARQASLSLPLSSSTPRVYPNSCPLSYWFHPTISSSVIPFSDLQSFLALGSFPVSQSFPLGGQSIGVSASTSVLPVNRRHQRENRWLEFLSDPPTNDREVSGGGYYSGAERSNNRGFPVRRSRSNS